MIKENFRPPMVLTLICLIICGLLVFAYEATYVDNTGVITEKLSGGLADVYGSADNFEMLKNDDGTVLTFDGVTSVLSDGKNTAFEITADGYSTDGLHVLVGINDRGTVQGVSIMTIGETPGLGTKVQNKDFLAQFSGLSYEQTSSEEEESSATGKSVWGTREEIDALSAQNITSDDGFALDAVTGATFSSEGMYNAVKTALNAYNQMGGADNG